jgi:hypothetical protein
VLSARRGAGTIFAHCDDKKFMKFNFLRTFVVPLCEGSLIHKYMHCSGEWSLLFRSVGEDLKVDVNHVLLTLEATLSALVVEPIGMHWKLEAKHELNSVLVEFHPPGAVVKVRAFADAVKQKMVDDAIITGQQKVKSG